MVRGVERIRALLPRTYSREAWGIDAGNQDQCGPVFSPMDGYEGRLARCPPTGRIRGRRGRPSLSRGRQPISTSIPDI